MNAAEPAAARARRWADEGGAPPDADARELAWALKELCYAAWGTDPALVERAAERLRELARGGDGETRALAAWTAGIAAAVRGRMDEAVAAFDDAAATFTAAALPDAAAQTQVPKIMALSMLGRHDEALTCADAAQRELRRLGNWQVAARVSQNLGSLHLRRDAYAEAAPHYREAAVLFARAGDPANSVGADIGLADTLTAIGDTGEALRIYARAGMRADAHGLALQRALVDESVALVELSRGRYREALAGFEAARRRYETLGMPQYLAIAEMQLADAYLELRLLPEALDLLERALAQFAALKLPDEQARALAQRGRAQLGLGRNADAEDSFAEAAALFAAQGNAVGGAQVALARAELSLAGGDAVATERFADDARAGFAAASLAGGEARAEAMAIESQMARGDAAAAAPAIAALLERAKARHWLPVQVRCLVARGRVASAGGDREAACAAFDEAIELFEDQRRALPADDFRTAYGVDHLRPYEHRLRIALDTGPGDEVLRQLERFRARAFDERLAEPPDPAGKRLRLNWLYRRLRRLQEESETSPRLGDEMRRTERELLENVRRWRMASPAPAAADAGAFDVAALQAALGPGRALVEYGAIDDEIFAGIVRHDRVVVHRRIATPTAIDDGVRALRFQIDALRTGAAALARHLPMLTQRALQRATQLREQVWLPIAGDLDGCREIVVVPHGSLATLPFTLVADGGDGAAPSIACAPSARIALRSLGRRLPAPRSALVLGDTDGLVHAATEAACVAAAFDRARVRVGEQATIAALRDEAAEADVVHLACHARFRADNPRFSALQLRDGPLTVDLAESLELGPATVVLSACETGLAAGGDEMVGLVRAFLVAGAARVVASLWPVDDETTASLMTSFYASLRDGRPAADALRHAQSEVRRRSPHPHHWAAFVLYGSF